MKSKLNRKLSFVTAQGLKAAAAVLAVAALAAPCLAHEIVLEWNRDFDTNRRHNRARISNFLKIGDQVLFGGARLLPGVGDLFWIAEVNRQMDSLDWQRTYGDSSTFFWLRQLHIIDGQVVAIGTAYEAGGEDDGRRLQFHYLDTNGDSLDGFELPLQGRGGPTNRASFPNDDGSIDLIIQSAYDGEYYPFSLFRVKPNHELSLERYYDRHEDFEAHYDGHLSLARSFANLRNGGYLVTGSYYFDRWYGEYRTFCSTAAILKLSEDGDLEWIYTQVDSVFNFRHDQYDVYGFNHAGEFYTAKEHSSGAIYVTGQTTLFTEDNVEIERITVCKFDPDGTLLWRQFYHDNYSMGGTGFFRIIELRSDILALFGHVRYVPRDERQEGMYVALMDTSGEMLTDLFIRGERIDDISDHFLDFLQVDSTRYLALTSQNRRVLSIRFSLDPPASIEFEDISAPPAAFHLEPAYPNPFNSSAVVRFALPAASPVRLEVYDVAGRRAMTLQEGMLPAGRHSVRWDAAGMESGLYFIRLNTPSFQGSTKALLVK